MNPGLIIGIALAVGIFILVASIGIGVLGYKPERAEAIRKGEAHDPVIIEEVRRIHVAAPDRFRRGRIDRHPFYLGAQVATFGYSICILAGAPITNNLASLSMGTRFAMAACFFVGSTLALCGAAMGARWHGLTVIAGIRDHIAASRLGDDIRLPYMFGILGMCSITVSKGIYASTSFNSTVGSLGGWLSGCLAVAAIIMVVGFYRRIRQFSLTLKVIVDEAIANVIARGEHVD